LIRKLKYFSILDFGDFLPRLIHWLYTNDYFSFFNGNNYLMKYTPFETFAAVGVIDTCIPAGKDPFEELKQFYCSGRDWIVGRLNYDLKNYVEDLSSDNVDRLLSEEMAFFIPETLIFIKDGGVEISSIHEPLEIYEDIMHTTVPVFEEEDLMITSDTTKGIYMDSVNSIKDQIIAGDFYELNYCMEFYTEMDKPDLASIYLVLNQISPMPFSTFQGINGQYILSASPERFMKKKGNRLIAQPIKGTARRDEDVLVDEKLKQHLQHSEKEIAENMMIVDLMRNDLGRSAVAGSVKVPEMFEVYSYNHVHQMISTIEASLRNDVHFIDAIKNAWPMGSMTGAPKIKVMEAIDQYENSKRGMFSGSAGYITPDGDFDFNVLIRSIFYSDRTNCLKFNAGSAITYDADPEYEYNECLLKTRPMREALNVVQYGSP
jgi:para-aminobenzoate synthetase component 1